MTGSALAALALCAVSYVAIPKLTAGGAPSAPPILLGSPSAAPAILPSPAAMPVAPPAPVGHVTADLSAPPLPAPVDPEVAAATLHIPDNVPVDQLWQAGSTYYNARRPAEASAFFWKAASSGDARGAAALGTAYVRGDGVIADVDMGVFWLTKSAAAGNRGAQFVLGGIYEQGISVQQDLPRAFDYRMQSAKQSFVPAEKAIALDYEFGRGTQRDRQQAIYWMQQAAIAGDREAQTLVAVLNDQRTPPMQDEHQLQAFIQANPNIHLVAAAPPVVQRPAPPVAQPAQQQQQQQQATRQPAQTYAAASTPAKKPAQAQRRQPSAADIRQAQAVMGLMRQSMGFGGIFGGAINNSVGPKTWGGGGGGGGGDSGGNPCEYYNEYAACQAHKNGDDWAADRIERHEASGSEKDWYDQ